MGISNILDEWEQANIMMSLRSKIDRFFQIIRGDLKMYTKPDWKTTLLMRNSSLFKIFMILISEN